MAAHPRRRQLFPPTPLSSPFPPAGVRGEAPYGQQTCGHHLPVASSGQSIALRSRNQRHPRQRLVANDHRSEARGLREDLSQGVADPFCVALEQVLWVDIHPIRPGIRQLNSRAPGS
jgi:hypothetical protein